MATEVTIYPRPVVDIDDVTATALIVKSTNDNKLTFNKGATTNIRTRTGNKCRLAFVGNSVDPGGESSITFHVKVNGTLLPPPYDSFSQALGVTYDPQSRLVSPVDIPQNALIEVTCDNSSTTTDYNAFVRVRLEYESLS